MARPRKYRHILNDRTRLSDHDNEYLPAKLYLAGEKPFPLSQRQKWRQQAGWSKKGRPAYIHKPSPNGRQDPLSICLVFDCLMRLETDGILQANLMGRILADNYPQVTWDSVTVGYILSSIADVVADRTSPPPLIRDRSGGLSYYIIADTIEARRWMGVARDFLGEAALNDVDAVRNGQENPLRLTIYEDLGLLTV